MNNFVNNPVNNPYIKCEEVITFLLAYLSNELPPEKEHEFERHLAVCPSCVAYMKTYQETVKLGRATYEKEMEAAPLDLGSGLVQAILGGRFNQ